MNPPNRIRDLALYAIVPLMLASAILNQQTNAWLLALGQLASTAGTLAAIAVLCATFPSRWWSWAVAAIVIALRIGRMALPEIGILLSLYEVATGVLYCGAGAVAAIERPALVTRHLWWTCVAGLPIMILQVVGVGEWTHALRTDMHDFGYGVLVQYPTLFRQPGEQVLNVIQSRPAGLFPSNNLLSFIVVFTLAWTFARPEQPRQLRRDTLLLAVAVLTMAKIVFLAMAAIFAWLFVAGGAVKRRRVLQAVATVVALVWTYAYLFPGLFDYNADWNSTVLNFKIRWNDLLYATGNQKLMLEAQANLMELPTTVEVYQEGQRQSGYAIVANHWPVLVAFALLFIPFYVKGLRYLRRHLRPLVLPVLTVLIACAIVPLISSFLGAVFFWFMGGVALLPLALSILRSYQELLRAAAGSRSSSPAVRS